MDDMAYNNYQTTMKFTCQFYKEKSNIKQENKLDSSGRDSKQRSKLCWLDDGYILINK